jgi:uncharacterized membrane protein YgcG
VVEREYAESAFMQMLASMFMQQAAAMGSPSPQVLDDIGLLGGTTRRRLEDSDEEE